MTIAVEAVGEDRTAVTMESTFTPKFGPLGWVMAKVMMNSKFRETFEGVLEGLESHVTTGLEVGEDGKLVEAAAD